MSDEWWKKGIIYQIYPRSFFDYNNDGIGDLKGITKKLEYLKWLGIDGVWLSPFFKSPMVDFGYDISDYTDVDPIFGTLDDFDEMVAKFKELDIKIILDLVSNHSSVEHPWFIESRVSKNSKKREWYFWRDPKPDGSPPNNWNSITTGKSAWTYDEHTQQYFLSSFNPCQPELNWRNPEVREAMLGVMKFWLDKGVDGFRIDMIVYMGKDEQLRDNIFRENASTDDETHYYSRNDPILYEFLRLMRNLIDKYPDKVLIGELPYLSSFEMMKAHYGENNDLIDIPGNFRQLLFDWDINQLKPYINEYEKVIGTDHWPNWTLGNHDTSRLISRMKDKEMRRKLGKLGAVMQLTLRGTPFIYYGEEIGMENVKVPQEKIKDPYYAVFPEKGRDPVRSPMQWTKEQNAGFSLSDPWLPVHENYKEVNVEYEKTEDNSYLQLYKVLIELRKTHKSLYKGDYTCILDVPSQIFAYTRQFESSQHLILLNFSKTNVEVNLPILVNSKVVLSTNRRELETFKSQKMTLIGYEGCILKLST